MIHIVHTVLVFSSMRTYAISNRSILLAALVGILSMVPVVTNAVRLDSESKPVQMKPDMFGNSGVPQEFHLYPWLPFFEAAAESLMRPKMVHSSTYSHHFVAKPGRRLTDTFQMFVTRHNGHNPSH